MEKVVKMDRDMTKVGARGTDLMLKSVLNPPLKGDILYHQV